MHSPVVLHAEWYSCRHAPAQGAVLFLTQYVGAHGDSEFDTLYVPPEDLSETPVLRHRLLVPYVSAALNKSESVSEGGIYSAENDRKYTALRMIRLQFTGRLPLNGTPWKKKTAGMIPGR